MNTIVFNAENGAVTEYSTTFQRWNRIGVDASGLYALRVGNQDAGEPIAASFTTPVSTWGAGTKFMPRFAYIAVRGQGRYSMTVTPGRADAPLASHTYPFVQHLDGRQRATFGQGLRDNWFSYTFRNVQGAPFLIDRFSIETAAPPARRVGS